MAIVIIVSLFGHLLAQAGNDAQPNPHQLTISNLTGDFYIYTTYNVFAGKPFPSNSMYVVTDSGVVLIDTPWDTTQFQPLLDSIASRHNKHVVLCIATHYHDDRTAGLEFFKKHGIATYTSQQTLDLCKQHGEPQAEFVFSKDTTFTVGNHAFQMYYPGEGHTKDNIVIWFGDEKILYGGCFVKSTEVNSLGNIADSNLTDWPISINNVMKQFPDPKFVVPGHFGLKSHEALQHTLELLQKDTEKGNR